MGSVRVLRKHWKLTAIAIFSLSIAMAVGVVSLSFSNTALLMAPAAAAPDRLVMIYDRSASEAISEISYPDYKYYREHNHVFTDVAAAPNSIQVDGSFDGKRWVKVIVRPVSDNYFAVMGIRPYLGGFFAPGDDQAKAPVAVMTYACWKRLGSDSKIVGKSVTGFTIAGVAAKDFTGALYGPNSDLFVSISKADSKPDWFTQRDARRLTLLARLKPGVSKREARAEMEALSGQLASAYPKDDKDRAAVVTRATLLPPGALPAAELIVAILMALVLMVLLIACANVANLLLAVAGGRRQEAAIKLALGAQRARLIREFLRESAMICAASAGLGYAIAAVAIKRLSTVTIDLPMLGTYTVGLDLRLDATVAAFTIALMLLAILATGLAPALYASSPGVGPNLAQVLGGEIVVGGTRKAVRRNTLVIVQVAMCTLVLVGMGLGQKDLYNLRHVDPGFSARNLVAATVYQTAEGYSEARGKELFGEMRRTVARLPGVEAVTLASDLPLALGYGETPVQIPGNDKKISVSRTTVDTDYFSTFGIPVLGGRVFNSGDRESSPAVVVINRKMAETLWPGQDPLGRAVAAGDPPSKATVVGVVGDGKYEELDETARACIYYALSQHYQTAITVIARTKGDPRLWIEPMSQTVQKLGLTELYRPVTYTDLVNFTLLGERVTANSVAVLSGLGLLLAIMGLFGAISYSVSERKKELGIRVALGARPGQLLRMVLRQTLAITGAGVAIGIAGGVGATIRLRSYFYGIGAVEWTVLVPVGAGMLGVSLLVAYVSARPWIRINPMEAVRHA